jgi:large subunit ribosomal protein L6
MFTVKGPLGTLTKAFRPHVTIVVDANSIQLTPARASLETKALIGTYAAHIKNMIAGVHTFFQKKLIIEGIGFKSEVKGTTLNMALGFSHPVNVPIPADLKVTAEKNIVTISGIDRENVGQFAAQVRAFKKPEPYLGKGIRYSDEVIRRKEGKKAA